MSLELYSLCSPFEGVFFCTRVVLPLKPQLTPLQSNDYFSPKWLMLGVSEMSCLLLKPCSAQWCDDSSSSWRSASDIFRQCIKTCRCKSLGKPCMIKEVTRSTIQCQLCEVTVFKNKILEWRSRLKTVEYCLMPSLDRILVARKFLSIFICTKVQALACKMVTRATFLLKKLSRIHHQVLFIESYLSFWIVGRVVEYVWLYKSKWSLCPLRQLCSESLNNNVLLPNLLLLKCNGSRHCR